MQEIWSFQQELFSTLPKDTLFEIEKVIAIDPQKRLDNAKTAKQESVDGVDWYTPRPYKA